METNIRTNNPAIYLCSLKQKISETIKGMHEVGINEPDLNNSLKDAMKKVDNVVSEGIRTSLIKKFGRHNWVIKVDNYIIPVLKGGKRNDYKYILKNIEWKNGPSTHEVHYYVIEKFLYYLTSKEYDSKIYTRHIPGIERRYSVIPIQKRDRYCSIQVNIDENKDPKTGDKYQHMFIKNPHYYCTFNPLPINGNEFAPIEINISKIIHKVNDKEVKQYYQLQVNEPKLRIPSLKAMTVEMVFLQLQEMLEAAFYMRDNTPQIREANAQLMKSVIVKEASAEPPSKGPEPLVRESDEEHNEEGEELAGTDQTDVYDDASIPGEEPNFDEGGLPPTPESIDHNYHDDQEPELMKDFEEESGQSPGADEEEAGEDPAEEASETPEEEAAEEAQEEAGGTEEAKLGYSISELIKFDQNKDIPLIIK